MNRGRQRSFSIGGYTVVETLIFLAVSSFIFISAVMLISGRQARTQFQTGVRTFETQLADIANDVATGYYQNPSVTSGCSGTGGVLSFSGANPGLGENLDCIFIGTVVKFGDGGNNEKFTQFTMAGLRQSGGDNVTSLGQAKPTVLDNNAGAFETKDIGSAIRVACISVGSGPCTDGDTQNAAIGFFTTFEGATLTGAGGGAVQADVINYGAAVTTAQTASNAAVEINKPAHYVSPTLNPRITICLIGGSNQYALVRLGGNASSSLAVTSEIKEGTSCS